MDEKELKRLSRADLLELLLVQTKETERLQRELDEVKEQLSARDLNIQEAGDLAHAVLAINHVMEDAQNAAQQYLENIAIMEERTRLKCERMIRAAENEAKRIRAHAPTDAGSRLQTERYKQR